MFRTRLIAFVILFGLFSTVGITLANMKLQNRLNEAQEEVEGMKDISGVPRVVNLAPIEVYVADNYEYTLSVVDSDSDLGEISLSLIESPSWIKAEGFRIHGVPSALDVGTHTVRYSLSDGVNTVVNSFYIVVVK